MAADLKKIMDVVNSDLKDLYKANPSGSWLYPCLILANSDGEVKKMDGTFPDNELLAWVAQNLDVKKLRQIIVGRMVVKHGKVIDPNTNAPTVTDKAIMIMGRDLATNRARLIITECKEHKDYRSMESIDKSFKTFDPSIKGADITKPIIDKDTGIITHLLTAKFGRVTTMDTRDGHTFVMDPLMANIINVRNLDTEIQKAEELNAPNIEKAQGLL